MVTWMSIDALKLPDMGKFRGKPDTEALIAISRFTQCFAVDLSNTLSWGFNVNKIHDFSGPVSSTKPSDVIDQRAKDIWSEKDQVAVLCAGDVDSVCALAAICKHAPDLSKVIVRYTKAGVNAYPKLFNEILPSLGVTMECRDGHLLVGDTDTFYVDGRTGDDWQAGYLSTTIKQMSREIDINDLEDVKVYIASMHDLNPKRVEAAVRGIDKFIDRCDFPIDNGWSLIVAIYRYFAVQHDVMVGHITEDHVSHSYAYRIPFFDHPSFTGASLYVASEGIPEEHNEGIHLRQYAYDYFKDQNWLEKSRPSSVFYIFRLGYFNTHYIDETFSIKGYDKLGDDL